MGAIFYHFSITVQEVNQSISSSTNRSLFRKMADQYKQYGQEKAGQAQQTTQGMMGTAQEKSGEMKDMTQQKASQATEATKGMGQSAMGAAQQRKEQTGSFFQQVVH